MSLTLLRPMSAPLPENQPPPREHQSVPPGERCLGSHTWSRINENKEEKKRKEENHSADHTVVSEPNIQPLAPCFPERRTVIEPDTLAANNIAGGRATPSHPRNGPTSRKSPDGASPPPIIQRGERSRETRDLMPLSSPTGCPRVVRLRSSSQGVGGGWVVSVPRLAAATVLGVGRARA